MAIDNKMQEARDDDRRLILRTELQAEYQELTKAKSALAIAATTERAGQVHRRSENIKALQRELARLGAQQTVQEYGPLAVQAKRRMFPLVPRSANGTAAFWNPYNRAPDPETSIDFSTTLRREVP